MKGARGQDRHHHLDETPNEIGMADIEERVKFLIQEILVASQTLRLTRDLSLGDRIWTFCRELSAAKNLVVQAMEAMKGNANRLEAQRLNNPDEELELNRAAEIARAEVERLSRIIEEIDAVLTMADAMHELEKTLDQERIQPGRSRLGDIEIEIENIFAELASLRANDIILANIVGSSEKYDLSDQRLPVVHSLTPPLLGNVPSSGLKDTLGKVRESLAIDRKSRSDLYKEILYKNNVHDGAVELSDAPFVPPTCPLGEELLCEDPILTLAGFNGSYVSPRVPGKGAYAKRKQLRTGNDTKS